MDGLTFVVKVLDVIVALAKCVGLGIVAMIALIFIRFLPRRIRKVVAVAAASVFFFTVLRENWYQGLYDGYLKLLPIADLMGFIRYGALPILSVISVLCVAILGGKTGKRHSFSLLSACRGAALSQETSHPRSALNLRQYTVLLQ